MTAELDIAFSSIEELVASFVSRELSPVEVTEHTLARIETLDAQLHS